MAALKHPLQCLAEIGEQVKPVGNLDGLWRTSGCTTDEFRPTVAGNHFDAGMRLEPLFKRCGTTLGQQIDWASLFQIEQDRAVALAFAEREIIDPEHARRHGRWRRQLPNQPQYGVTAGWEVEALARTHTNCATKRQTHLLECLA